MDKVIMASDLFKEINGLKKQNETENRSEQKKKSHY
jgi:hypothetical protein